MADGTRILDGLRHAVAHAKGEATGAREHVTVSKAELDALRAVAEAAVPFAAHAASIDAQADAGDLPRWRDSGCRYVVMSHAIGLNTGLLAFAPKLRPDGTPDCEQRGRL